MFSLPFTYHRLYCHSFYSPVTWLLVALLFLAAHQNLSAQNRDTTQTKVERDIERAIEEIDPEESDLDPEVLAEFLQDLASNPLNINRASADDLLQIPGVNFRTAQNIVQYRTETAPFETPEDLVSVSGIGSATLSRMRPYITVGTRLEQSQDLYLNPKYWSQNGRIEVFSRYRRVLNEQEGYKRPFSEGGYAGNPVQYYQRVRYSSNHLSAVLTQDKDPGEPLTEPSDFDYTGWHFALKDNGKLKDLIVGDYSIAFGQGLLLWTGGSFGKGSEVIRSISKNERGARPYTSAQETNAFRGVAATYGDQFQVTGFYSSRKRTATQAGDDEYRFPQTTGYHRTQNEIGRKHNLTQQTAGGRVRYQISNGYIGASGYYNRFDKTIVPGTLTSQVFDFTGREQTAFSADYRLLFGPALLFGEAVYTDNGGYGVLSGSEFNLGNSTDLVLAYRYYDKTLQAIFGAGFGEQSGTPGNEEGFYIGLRHSITKSLQVSTYMDQFRFPAARFRVSRPSSGFDWLGLIEFKPTQDLNLYGQFRYKKREQDYTTMDEMNREIRLLGEHIRTSARFQLEYQVHPLVRLRTRFDSAITDIPGGGTSRGYLIYQDIRVFPHPDITIDARATLFDTDDFESRVYQFENDLLYVLSNTMLFDQGQRMYLVINYEAAEWLEFWFKVSSTMYENRNTISSGLAEIKGNRRSDIGVQARVRF